MPKYLFLSATTDAAFSFELGLAPRLTNGVELSRQGQLIERLDPETREDFQTRVKLGMPCGRPAASPRQIPQPLPDHGSPNGASSADRARLDRLPELRYRRR